MAGLDIVFSKYSIAAGGIALIALGLAADAIRLGGYSGFGWKQAAVTILGAALLTASFALARKPRGEQGDS